jgi:hypothetical protein
MLRCSIAAVAALSLMAAPAEAARLVHPSGVAKSAEKGVTVWRGKARIDAAPPTLKATPPTCASKTVVVFANALPERRLRTQGFWSGDGLTPGMRLTRRPMTQGFYADRIAAGL